MVPPRSRPAAPPPPPGKRRHVGWVWEVDDAPRETVESKLREAQKLAEALAVREVMSARLGTLKAEEGKAGPSAKPITGAAASAMERRSERAQMRLLLSAKYKEDGDLDDGRRTRGKRLREASARRQAVDEQPSKRSRRSTREDPDSDLSSVLSDREDEPMDPIDAQKSAVATPTTSEHALEKAPASSNSSPLSAPPIAKAAEPIDDTLFLRPHNVSDEEAILKPASDGKAAQALGIEEDGPDSAMTFIEESHVTTTRATVQSEVVAEKPKRKHSGRMRGPDKKKRKSGRQTGPFKSDGVPLVADPLPPSVWTHDDTGKKGWKTSAAAKEQWDAVRKANPALKFKGPLKPFGARPRPRPDPLVLVPHAGASEAGGPLVSAQDVRMYPAPTSSHSSLNNGIPSSATSARINSKAYKQVPLGSYRRTFSLASLSGDESVMDREPPTASTLHTQLTHEIRLEHQSGPSPTESSREGSAGGRMGKINLSKLLKQAREKSHTDEVQTDGENSDIRGRAVTSDGTSNQTDNLNHHAPLPGSATAPSNGGGLSGLPLAMGPMAKTSRSRGKPSRQLLATGELHAAAGSSKTVSDLSSHNPGITKAPPAPRRDYAKAASRYFQPAQERQVGLAAMMARPQRRVDQPYVTMAEPLMEQQQAVEAIAQSIAHRAIQGHQESLETDSRNGMSDTAPSPANGISDTDSANQKEHFYCPRPGCTKLYQQRAGLKYHLAKGHCQYRARESYAYPCLKPGCNKTYSSAGGLRQHSEKDNCRQSGSSHSPPQATPDSLATPAEQEQRPPPSMNSKPILSMGHRKALPLQRPLSPPDVSARLPSRSLSPSPPPRRITASVPQRQETPPTPEHETRPYRAYQASRQYYPPPQQYYPPHPMSQPHYPSPSYYHHMPQPEPEERSYLLSRFMEAAEPEPQPVPQPW